MDGRVNKLVKLLSVIQTCCAAALYGCCRARLLPSSCTWRQCCRVAAIENHLAPALQGCCAAGLLVCRGTGLLCCRAAAQCGCFDAGLLSHRATFRVARVAVVALCCRAAVCSAAALQGRCTAALLHCRSGVQQGMRGVNNTPAQAKKGEVNANVNSIMLKSLPKLVNSLELLSLRLRLPPSFLPARACH